VTGRLPWLLLVLAGCTGFHDAILSYEEHDADGEEDAAQESPASADAEPLDTGPPASDAASSALNDATGGALDAAVAELPDARAPSDASAAISERSCCQLWDDLKDGLLPDLLDGGLLESLRPNPCIEWMCKPPLPGLLP
jgi:hypothetical protein